jgi:hypothetical protein
MDTITQEIPLAEAAQQLKKSWGQAWRLVLNGTLAGRKVGGRWVVTAESVKANRAES